MGSYPIAEIVERELSDGSYVYDVVDLLNPNVSYQMRSYEAAARWKTLLEDMVANGEIVGVNVK